MTWNHRVVKDSGGYRVAEVYYDDAQQPHSYCEPFTCTDVETDPDPLAALKSNYARMLAACELPVLNFPEDFKSSGG